jgi:hypothetical protein
MLPAIALNWLHHRRTIRRAKGHPARREVVNDRRQIIDFVRDVIDHKALPVQPVLSYRFVKELHNFEHDWWIRDKGRTQ